MIQRLLLLVPLLAAGCATEGALPDADAAEVQRLFTQGCYFAQFDEARSRAVFGRAGLVEERITNAAIFTSPDGAVRAELLRFSQPGGNGQQCSVGGLGVPITAVNGLAIRLIESEGGPKGDAKDRSARDGIAIIGFGEAPGEAVAISTSREPRAIGGTDFVAIEMTRVTQ